MRHYTTANSEERRLYAEIGGIRHQLSVAIGNRDMHQAFELKEELKRKEAELKAVIFGESQCHTSE